MDERKEACSSPVQPGAKAEERWPPHLQQPTCWVNDLVIRGKSIRRLSIAHVSLEP